MDCKQQRQYFISHMTCVRIEFLCILSTQPHFIKWLIIFSGRLIWLNNGNILGQRHLTPSKTCAISIHASTTETITTTYTTTITIHIKTPQLFEATTSSDFLMILRISPHFIMDIHFGKLITRSCDYQVTLIGFDLVEVQ